MSLWRKLLGISPERDDEPRDPGETSRGSGPIGTPETGALPRAALAEESERPDVSPLAMARKHQQAGELQKALDVLFEHVRGDAGGASEIRFELASLLLERGEWAPAIRVVEPALLVPGARQQALALMSELHELLGQREQAAAFCERLMGHSIGAAGVRARWERLRGEGHGKKHQGVTVFAAKAPLPSRYRVIRQVGVGGAGTVFEVREAPLSRSVALKLYHRQSDQGRARLLREARVPAKLNHRGVVRVFDVDLGAGVLAMEWLARGSVRHAMGQEALELGRVLGWLRSTAEAMAAVHAAGYVHRDLKPSNLLLRNHTEVVVTDFGLSLPIGKHPDSRSGAEGTLGYMAPEQRQGRPAHPAEDIFAFGACIRSLISCVGQGSEGEEPRLSGGDAPGRWLALADRCMSPNQAVRPDAKGLLEALDPCAGPV